MDIAGDFEQGPETLSASEEQSDGHTLAPRQAAPPILSGKLAVCTLLVIVRSDERVRQPYVPGAHSAGCVLTCRSEKEG